MSAAAAHPMLAFARQWTGSSVLQDLHNNIAETSTSAAAIVPVLQDRFVRLDYDWSYQNKPQSGTMFIAFDPKTQAITAHWADTWHMGRSTMTLKGTAEANRLTLHGTYPAPPGPDWGWRIDLLLHSPDAFELVMFNVYPDGEKEELAVRAQYRKS